MSGGRGRATASIGGRIRPRIAREQRNVSRETGPHKPLETTRESGGGRTVERPRGPCGYAARCRCRGRAWSHWVVVPPHWWTDTRLHLRRSVLRDPEGRRREGAGRRRWFALGALPGSEAFAPHAGHGPAHAHGPAAAAPGYLVASGTARASLEPQCEPPRHEPGANPPRRRAPTTMGDQLPAPHDADRTAATPLRRGPFSWAVVQPVQPIRGLR